jgi:hypothetical protein
VSQGETKTPVEEVVQQVAEQSGDQPEVQVPDDVDAQALAAAQAELKAEQAKAQEAPQVADAPKVEEPKKDQPSEGEKPKHIPGMVPLSVLQKVASQRNEAERKIAFLEGRLSIAARHQDERGTQAHAGTAHR